MKSENAVVAAEIAEAKKPAKNEALEALRHKKMVFILCLCVAYCIAMATTCRILATKPFKGNTYSDTSSCGSFVVEEGRPTIEEVASRFQRMLIFGFLVHGVGAFCDFGVLVRQLYPRKKILGYIAVVACSIYTLAFIVWVVMMHTTRYNEEAKRCSGAYLTEEERASLSED